MKINGEEQNKTGAKSFFSTKTLTTLAILMAMEIVLTRFLSIWAWNIRIGFGFVPIVIAAMLYGPTAAALLAGVSDVLGALMFPTGPFFPGFTLTAVLTGLTFGFLLHKKQSIVNIVLSVGIVQFILGLLVNTYWISVLYSSPFVPLLTTRVVQSASLFIVQIVTIRLLAELPKRFPGRFAA